MTRTVTALAVLALLSVATAERSLQAHKASGGSSLHALAITDAQDSNNEFYYTTNGNGTWAAMQNRAFWDKSNCYGSTSVQVTTAITGTTVPTSDTGFLSPFFKVGASITDVTFPSRLLGVAVGTGCSGMGAYTDIDGIAQPPSTSTAVPISYVPNVLTSFDQGKTWQVVTGFSTTPKSFAQTRQITSNLQNALVTAATFVANPAPDFMSVHCTTRSLCFAAGGYFPTINSLAPGSAVISNYNLQVQAAVIPSTSATTPTFLPSSLPVAGAIIRSTNGGTYWSYVSLPSNVAATATAPPQPIPGLVGIHTDSSGRHVYAVGAPFFLNDYSAPATNSQPASFGPGSIYNGGTAPFSVSPTSVAGSIVYSGSYGVSNSWVVQVAPVIPGYWYSLNAVHVLRGTAAITVGGSPFGVTPDVYNLYVTGSSAGTTATAIYTRGAAAPLLSSGLLLITLNGGFSWVKQILPSWSFWTPQQVYISTPASIGPNYVTGKSSSATLPALNDVACYSTVQSSAAYYNCIAVGNYGYLVKASLPAVTVANSIVTSTAQTSWSYQNITQVALSTGFLDLYGLSWDNNMVGYIYGEEIILSTHDGGVTWVPETPNYIVTQSSQSTQSSINVVGLATVPTTY